MLNSPQRNPTSTARPGEDQWRRVEERVANAVGPGERAAEQQTISSDRIVADEQDENAADDESRDNGD